MLTHSDARLATPSDNEIIRAEVEKIIASGLLGRSRFYTALLQYLADCGQRGHSPKEIEIAAEVFNRGEGFDPAQDSMVRVYAHNLRQKLEQYYVDSGTDDSKQILIPKGEYRITLGGETVSGLPPAAEPATRARLGVALLVAASLVAGILIGRVLGPDASGVAAELGAVADTALWAPVTADDEPVTIVVGDYYIFGEIDEIGNIDRLVREFSINSSRDLDDRKMLDPEAADRYLDLELTYLPSSIAFAMRDIVGILLAADKEISVVAMSNLDTSAIRDGHIVYVGFLSGLGMLRDFAFAGSELTVGDTFDEIVNRETGEVFISEAGMPSGQSYRDYGFFATLPAPGNHQFVFIAGTRDEGLMQTARAVSDPETVRQSIAAVSDGETPRAFEILYEVAGLARTSLDAMIVHAAALDSERIAIGQLAQ